MIARQAITILAILAVCLPCLAGKPTAVISSSEASGLAAECRSTIEDMLGELNLRVLAKQADAATADVVLEVSCKTEKDQASCTISAFVTPTGPQLGEASSSADTQAMACQKTARQIKDEISPKLAKLLKTGFRHVLVLRWSGKLAPKPAGKAGTFLKSNDIEAKAELEQAGRCSFSFTTTKTSAEIEDALEDFLKIHYRIEREPPNSLPRSPRTYMYLLKSL